MRREADQPGAPRIGAEAQKRRRPATHVHALHRVRVDDLLVVLALLVGVRALVDELHLLENRRLARLSGSEQEHFAAIERGQRLCAASTHGGTGRTSHSCSRRTWIEQDRYAMEMNGDRAQRSRIRQLLLERSAMASSGTHRMAMRSLRSWFSISSERALPSWSAGFDPPQPIFACSWSRGSRRGVERVEQALRRAQRGAVEAGCREVEGLAVREHGRDRRQRGPKKRREVDQSRAASASSVWARERTR